MYKRKTRDYWAVECKYDRGWEEVYAVGSKNAAYDRYKKYLDCDNFASGVRFVKRRERINE